MPFPIHVLAPAWGWIDWRKSRVVLFMFLSLHKRVDCVLSHSFLRGCFQTRRNKSFHYTLAKAIDGKKYSILKCPQFGIPAFQASCITCKPCISVHSHSTNTGLGLGDGVIHRLFSLRIGGVWFSSSDFCSNLMYSISELMYRKLIVYFHNLAAMDLIA